jgi:DNA adenine methylase
LLRYPGGKSRAVDQLLPFFAQQPGILCSPFFGGGSLELALAARGWRVHGYDAFRPLVDFWQCALTEPLLLADAVERHHPLSRQQFYLLKEEQLELQIERAAAYYAINRASFSGSTLSGGMSPGHPRFTESCIERLRRFTSPNVWVEQSDFQESIARHPTATIYGDPPYPDATGLYGRDGDLHDGFDHLALAETLRSRENWILSYSDCPQVRQMYDGYEIVPAAWKYGMSSDKDSREILILSRDLATTHKRE